MLKSKAILVAIVALLASSVNIPSALAQGGGGGGSGGSGPSSTPTPPPPADYNCEIRVNAAPTNLSGEVAPNHLPQEVVNNTVVSGGTSIRHSDFSLLTVSCKPNEDMTLSLRFATSLQSCESTSQGLCYEDYKYKLNSMNVTLEKDKDTWVPNLKLILMVKGSGQQTVDRSSVRVIGQRSNGGLEKQFDLDRVIVFQPEAANESCRLIVSGAVGGGSGTGTSVINVSNGDLQFYPALDGVVGNDARIKTIRFSGGPDQTGRWDSAPTEKVSKVEAEVTTITDRRIKCSVQVQPVGKGARVKIAKYGDCAHFAALRNYYFMNGEGATATPRSQGYGDALRYPGIDADYGKFAPEVPFKGFLNGAATLSGQISTALNGVVQLPPLDQRFFSKAVIIAKTLDTKSMKISDGAVYYGVIDYTNFNETELTPVPGASIPNDEDTLVFQVFLAGAHRDATGLSDLRGTEQSFPNHSFIPAAANDRLPYDRIVPLMNESCSPLFQVSVPTIPGKEVPDVLKSTVTCTYSRPFKFSDFANGRVSLTALGLVPEHAFHQFPFELMKGSGQAACVSQNPANQVPCWNVKASDVGQNEMTSPFKNHDKCRKVTVIDKPTQYCNKYGCRTIVVKTTVIEYTGSCPVLENNGPAGGSECGKTLAVRFSGYSQALGAALGCAVKYAGVVPSGDVVSPTLRNEGIMPYTSFGGDRPKHYTNYSSNKVSRNNNQNMGYACIPCRFASKESAAGRDLFAETKPLPVDQDSSTPRKPIFKFDQMMAPRDCVKDVQFEVRYFGSGACDGVNAPPGHFCTSENVEKQNCQTTDNTGAFTGGGNVAGRFKVPVCPGSGFQYDSVAVSWSPIILDIAGNGITISRDFPYAVRFDIKGTGKAVMVDWPINVKEVAFLVRPNAAGQVTSIKELFGDYKAKNGFEALRKLDSNKDGRIDANDKEFASLKLWHDYNRNGVSDEGEISSLESAFVESISLSYNKPMDKGIEGKTLTSVYFNGKDKRLMNVVDSYFYEYLSNGSRIDGKGADKK